MFTGIVHSEREIVHTDLDASCGSIRVRFDDELLRGLSLGASVAVDGVCLTASAIDGQIVTFDVVQSTIRKTNLLARNVGDYVNVERSYAVGDEVGGHDVSGHVDCAAEVVAVEESRGNVCQTYMLPVFWMKYLFPEGFVAVNGASLTVSDIDKQAALFTVWLIPETLRRTNLKRLSPGDKVNIEVHKGVQVIVDALGEAVERTISKAIDEGRLSPALLSDLMGTTDHRVRGLLPKVSDPQD